MNYTTRDIAELGTILGVFAHPDDECWTSGGVLAAACQNGQRVVCITATRGDAGKTANESRWPQAQLGRIREHELDDSLACLGSIEHHWLDYGDGTLKDTPALEPIRHVADLIKEVRPDTVITFGPDGLTGHPDHKAVYGWTQAALRACGHPARLLLVREGAEKYNASGKILDAAANMYFATDKPVTCAAAEADVYFALPPDIYRKKIASLKAHQSQMSGIFAHPEGGPALLDYAKSECFVRAPAA